MQNSAPIQAALDVLTRHLDALNTRDETALAATLHFPHVRLSGQDLRVWNSAKTYFSEFLDRAGDGWARSGFDDIRVVQTSRDKVHVDLRVSRYDANGDCITTFRSLWVITQDNGRWAAKLRSSFSAT